jgi:hypothetical protein
MLIRQELKHKVAKSKFTKEITFVGWKKDHGPLIRHDEVCEFIKHEVSKYLGVGPLVIARGHVSGK